MLHPVYASLGVFVGRCYTCICLPGCVCRYPYTLYMPPCVYKEKPLRKETSFLCYSRFTVGGQFSPPTLFPFHCWRRVLAPLHHPFPCWLIVLTSSPSPVSLLGYSRCPCATLLSVAGLWAIITRFTVGFIPVSLLGYDSRPSSRFTVGQFPHPWPPDPS